MLPIITTLHLWGWHFESLLHVHNTPVFKTHFYCLAHFKLCLSFLGAFGTLENVPLFCNTLLQISPSVSGAGQDR